MGVFYVNGASGAESSAPLETVSLTVGKEVFRVELARDKKAWAKGLSGRKTLASDSGMLFVYQDNAKRRFWMKNTHIPLSLAYISPNGTITEIIDLVPLSEKTVPSKYPAQYVLELNKGAFHRAGVKAGDNLDFEALKKEK
jgi:uncharacterized membrane protein (UPF0127 family)